MTTQKIKLKDIRFYRYPTDLDTSSFPKFMQSLFQVVPTSFWIYISLVSIIFPLYIRESSFFLPTSPAPSDMTLLNFYTFIVMVLSPLTLTYIRFVKPFSFTSIYMGLAKFEDDSTARHNQRVRAEKHKIYADDRYQFTYNKHNGKWHGKNIDAERRHRKTEKDQMGWFIKLGYPVFLCFFLIIYMIMMYHIIVPVAGLVALHMFYQYKKIKQKKKEFYS